jgi:hypothetical protein
LKPDQTVSVYSVAASGKPNLKTTGKVLALSDDTLRLLVHGHPQDFMDRDVRVISETYKGERRKAALIGLSVGGALGLLNLAHWCQARRDADSCGNATGALLMWTGLGAAFGAASAREHERVLFLAP